MEGDYPAVGNNSSILSFDDQAHILDNKYVRAGLILVYALIFLVCFLGNLALILVVTLQWKARLLSKFYLGNMAAANLSVALFCIPQNLTLYLLDRWIFGELMCKMFHFVTNLCHTASILILVVVSIERYITLVHAFRGRQVLTVRWLQVIMLLVWLVSAGVSLPRFFYCGLIRIPLDDEGTTGEICVPKRSTYNSATADLIYFVVLYALPLAVMSVMYVRIGAHVRKYEKMRAVPMENIPRDISTENNDAGRRGSSGAAHVAHCSSTASKSSLSVMHSFGTRGKSQPQVKNLSRLTHTSDHSCSGKLAKRNRRSVPGHFANDKYQTGSTLPSNDRHRTGLVPVNLARPTVERSRLKLSRVRCQKRQSVVRMLKSIVLTFAILNLPFHVRKLCVNFMPSFDMSSNFNNLMAPLTFVLMYANCAANPIVYVSMSKRFRGSLRDLIRKFTTVFSRPPDFL